MALIITKPLADVKQLAIAAVNELTSSTILSKFSIIKQINMQSRVLTLLTTDGSDKSELDQLKLNLQWIESIKDKSNEINAAINVCTSVQDVNSTAQQFVDFITTV